MDPFSKKEVDNILGEAIWIAEYIHMPFGKHKGTNLVDVPLSYLDETISIMPPTWFVRRVQKFVDCIMAHGQMYGVITTSHAPSKSAKQLLEDILGLS